MDKGKECVVLKGNKSSTGRFLGLKRFITIMVMGLFLMPLFLGFFQVYNAQAVESARPKAVLVLINRVTLDDLLNGEYTNIKKLISIGGLGVMNINTGRDFSDASAYVTLGGGDRLIGSRSAGESFNRNEIVDGFEAFWVYKRNTGIYSGNSQVLNTTIASTLKLNFKRYTVSSPGLLGTTLHNKGLKTAVIGNSDLAPDDEPNRLAVAVAMDSNGCVDYGNVSRELLKKDPLAPYGWRTDYKKLNMEFEKIWDVSDFIVVETGDTLRANSSGEVSMKKMAEYHRKEALTSVDNFIGSLISKIDKDTLLMMVTPLPHNQALRDGIKIAPVIMAGGGILPGSVLTSPSTRQNGLISNFDIAATVISHLSAVKSDGIMGLPVSSVDIGNSENYVIDLSRWLTSNNLQRGGLLFYFTRFQWIIYLLLSLKIVFKYRYRDQLAKFLVTAVLMSPLSILLAPLFSTEYIWSTLFVIIIILLVLSFIVTRTFKDHLKMYSVIGLLNAFPIILDVLSGSNLLKRAALSYDLVVGGRYYGVGNEYMGVLLGSVILACTALIQSLPGFKKLLIPLISLLFTGLVIFFASPSLGTNAGGSIAAVVGFVLTVYKLLGRKITLKSGLVMLSSVMAGIGVLVTVNYLFSIGASSHIGRAVNDLFQGNLMTIWHTVQRKFSANFYLLSHSPFSILLVFQAGIWGALYLINKTLFKKLLKNLPDLKAGITGMFYGALAAFIFNDSGVIASALLLNYLVLPVVLLVFNFNSDLKEINSSSRILYQQEGK